MYPLNKEVVRQGTHSASLDRQYCFFFNFHRNKCYVFFCFLFFFVLCHSYSFSFRVCINFIRILFECSPNVIHRACFSLHKSTTCTIEVNCKSIYKLNIICGKPLSHGRKPWPLDKKKVRQPFFFYPAAVAKP